MWGSQMKIKVVEERDNPFFNRKDLKLSLSHPGKPTPPKSELVKELASKFGVDQSQVVVDYIFTRKGAPESLSRVRILKEKPKIEKKEVKEKKEGGKPEAQTGQTE
jgi:ribosomal protein S24E